MKGLREWGASLPAPCVGYDGLRQWGRFAISKGGLAFVGVLVALTAIGLWVEVPPEFRLLAFAPLAMLLQLVAHEAGHALAAIACGYSVKTVFVAGTVAGVEPARSSQDIAPRHLLWIALGGPGANALAAVGVVVWVIAGGWTYFLVALFGAQIIAFLVTIFPTPGKKASGAVVVSWPALGLVGAASDGYYAMLMLRGPGAVTKPSDLGPGRL